jgi:hypothetical protein
MIHTTHYAQHNALKMNGVFVKLDRADFQNLLNRHENLAVVVYQSKFLGTTFTYVTSHKGLAFYCKTKEPLSLPGKHEIFNAGSIALPLT